MLTLAIDTATENLSLALARDDGLLAEDGIDAGRKHLELLLPHIVRLLGRLDLKFDDLDSIIVGTGPGTFSGLRVGIATARGLAQALEIPIQGASTLEALARGIAAAATTGPRVILPVIDAKRGQVFSRVFRIDPPASLECLSGIECLDPEGLADFAAAHSDTAALAGGNGARAYHGVLSRSVELELLPEADDHNRVRAANLLAMACEPPGTKMEDLCGVVPVYVREPDADKTVLLRKREPWLK